MHRLKQTGLHFNKEYFYDLQNENIIASLRLILIWVFLKIDYDSQFIRQHKFKYLNVTLPLNCGD